MEEAQMHIKGVPIYINPAKKYIFNRNIIIFFCQIAISASL